MGIASLDAALSGLRAAQEQMAVLASNIANASTPGYTRKTLPQETRVAENISIGVATGSITRSVDLTLSRDLWAEQGQATELATRAAYLGRIESFHGAPEDETSIAARVAALRDNFVNLMSDPQDYLRQEQTITAAQDLARRMRDYAMFLTTLRNDAQGEMETTVARVNDLLERIADSNRTIQDALSVGRTTAEMEDARDVAINELSDLIEVSFFKRGDGVLVIKTAGGVELAATEVRPLTFRATSLGAESAYPESAAGVYVGDPLVDTDGGIDITATGVGGKLGGLIELRDGDIPQQMAQLDELAHKLTMRLEGQGLRLFTDGNGDLPADWEPNPLSDPKIAVPYVGYAAQMEVNSSIVGNPALLVTGTRALDVPVAPGSDAVLRRVVDYAFGSISHQQATGTVDIRATANGAADLLDWLGVTPAPDPNPHTIVGTRNIAAELPNLVDAPGSPFATDVNDRFYIVLDPRGEGPGPINNIVNIGTIFPAGNATAYNLASQIDAYAHIDARINEVGQLEISSVYDIELRNFDMGQAGFDYLGLSEGIYGDIDPYFDVQVGNDPPVRITIREGMDEADLIDALILDSSVPNDTGVPGLAYDAATYAATGQLILRPGDDFNSPNFGGELRITAGPFLTDGTGGSGVPAGVNLVSALFGSYDVGPPIADLSPVTDVPNGPFRTQYLGPGVDISTGITGATDIVDYAQKMISQQATTLNSVEAKQADSRSLADLLRTQQLNESGVNVDEELAYLIQVQTAFSASARVVSVVQEMFDELLDSV